MSTTDDKVESTLYNRIRWKIEQRAAYQLSTTLKFFAFQNYGNYHSKYSRHCPKMSSLIRVSSKKKSALSSPFTSADTTDAFAKLFMMQRGFDFLERLYAIDQPMGPARATVWDAFVGTVGNLLYTTIHFDRLWNALQFSDLTGDAFTQTMMKRSNSIVEKIVRPLLRTVLPCVLLTDSSLGMSSTTSSRQTTLGLRVQAELCLTVDSLKTLFTPFIFELLCESTFWARDMIKVEERIVYCSVDCASRLWNLMCVRSCRPTSYWENRWTRTHQLAFDTHLFRPLSDPVCNEQIRNVEDTNPETISEVHRDADTPTIFRRNCYHGPPVVEKEHVNSDIYISAEDMFE